jgi:arabinose-5-phosphate isomerase
MSKINFLATAKQVLTLEAQAIENLIPNLNSKFNDICQLILECTGKLVVTGMGKSGHIAKKIAATMASTGTPAFFIHPGEASHGDLGMISSKDIVLIFSNSGETDELITIIPALKTTGVKIIAITSNDNSRIAKNADLHLDLNITKEACPLNLAPTTSTTCALAIGDALAICLLNARGFDQHDFAKYHPAGRLGKRLLLTVGDIMHSGAQIPIVTANTPLLDGIVEMSKKCFGLLLVAEEKFNQIIGVFSDGDLRRTIDNKVNINTVDIKDVMNINFKFIGPNALLTDAINLMEHNKIFTLPVVENNNIVGIFNMHDILHAGIL